MKWTVFAIARVLNTEGGTYVPKYCLQRMFSSLLFPFSKFFDFVYFQQFTCLSYITDSHSAQSMLDYGDLSRASSSPPVVADANAHRHRVRHHQQQHHQPTHRGHHHQRQQPAPLAPAHYRAGSGGHGLSESARRYRHGSTHGSRPALSRALFNGHAAAAQSSDGVDARVRDGRVVSPYAHQHQDAHLMLQSKSFAAPRQRAREPPARLVHTGSLGDVDAALDDDPFHGQYHAMRGHRKSLSFPRFNVKDGESTILSLLRHGSPHANSSSRGMQSRQPPLSPSEVRRLRQFEAALAAQHLPSNRPPIDASLSPSFPDKGPLNHSLSTGAIDFSRRPGHISPPAELSSHSSLNMWRDPPLERSASSQPYMVASANHRHRQISGEPRYHTAAPHVRQRATAANGGKSVLLSTLDQGVSQRPQAQPQAHAQAQAGPMHFRGPSVGQGAVPPTIRAPPPPAAAAVAHTRSASNLMAASQPVSPVRTFVKAPDSPTDSGAFSFSLVQYRCDRCSHGIGWWCINVLIIMSCTVFQLLIRSLDLNVCLRAPACACGVCVFIFIFCLFDAQKTQKRASETTSSQRQSA